MFNKTQSKLIINLFVLYYLSLHMLWSHFRIKYQTSRTQQG